MEDNNSPKTDKEYKNEDGEFSELLKDAPDVLLDESVNILGDYIELLQKGNQ